MITTAVEKLVFELKTMPFTLLTVLALVGFAVYAFENHADAQDIHVLAEKVDKNSKSIDRVLILQIAESLRNLQIQRCELDDVEGKRTLSHTIEALQDDYRLLTGSRYPLRDCD